MDHEFDKIKEKLTKLSGKKTLDEYWKNVSRTIEKARTKHPEHDKETAKKH